MSADKSTMHIGGEEEDVVETDKLEEEVEKCGELSSIAYHPLPLAYSRTAKSRQKLRRVYKWLVSRPKSRRLKMRRRRLPITIYRRLKKRGTRGKTR